MQVSRTTFSVTLPDGFVEQPEDADMWSAVNANDDVEVTIETTMVVEVASIVDVLKTRAESRLDLMRRNDGAVRDHPIRFETRDDLRIGSFLAVGQDSLVFCANLTHETPIVGARCLLTFCVRQRSKPGVASPNVDTFERVARSVLATVRLLPARAAIERGDAMAAIVDTTQIYPCPTSRDHLEGRPADAPCPRTIGHELYLGIAARHDGRWRINFPEDMFEMRDAVVAVASDNLARVAHDGGITFHVADGPRDLPYVVVGPDEWLASSCLFLPELERFLASRLGQGPFCASIPHRSVMIAFRKEDAAYRAAMRELIAAAEEGNQSAVLTNELFVITPDGVEPFREGSGS